MIHAQRTIQHQRIRGPNLALAIYSSSGVPFEEALRIINDSNRVIASNKRIDTALQTFEWKIISRAFPCWIGTIVGYEEPGKGFGKTIESLDFDHHHQRWVFPVPEKYRGEKNAVLVAEHPDYILEADGNNRVIHIPENKVDIVRAFPISKARKPLYLTDPVHRIPVTENGDESAGKRHLDRRKKGVFPIDRQGIWHPEWNQRNISLISNAFYPHCGVAVEAMQSEGSYVDVYP